MRYIISFKTYSENRKMTSVLYSAGLNYQMGNPVRQEIVAVRREVDALRKQVEQLTEENLVYRKHLMKLLSNNEDQEKARAAQSEFTRDLMLLVSNNQSDQQRQAGSGTVQGGGFRR
jgi:predicted transcriptional regulator